MSAKPKSDCIPGKKSDGRQKLHCWNGNMAKEILCISHISKSFMKISNIFLSTFPCLQQRHIKPALALVITDIRGALTVDQVPFQALHIHYSVQSSQEAYRVKAVIMPFTDQGPEAQRGKVTCPRSHRRNSEAGIQQQCPHSVSTR